MLRKIVPMLALLAVPAIASAQFEAGDYEVTLSGNASAPKSLTAGAIGVTGSLGYFFTKELEAGADQNLSYISSSTSGSNISGAAFGGQTDGFVNYHFDMGAWQPFVGGKLGYVYPEGVHGQWFIAPVLGVKYFVNGTTFVFTSVEYDYAFSKPSNSIFAANLGIGFRF